MKLATCLFPLLAFAVFSCSPLKDADMHGHRNNRPPVTSSNNVVNMLYSQYDLWRDTPYRYGGLSKKGIDCSGLAYLVFDEIFEVQLPRTAKEQRKNGRVVFLDHLLPGDLLFFKTGWFAYHVGIYIEIGNFLHSSTSSGVRISNLSEPYWRNAFETAKRIDML